LVNDLLENINKLMDRAEELLSVGEWEKALQLTSEAEGITAYMIKVVDNSHLPLEELHEILKPFPSWMHEARSIHYVEQKCLE